MTPYTLEPVAKASPYTNISGEGHLLVKVRAVVRDPDTGRISQKRGVAFATRNALDAGVFVANVEAEWDGVGTLEFIILDPAQYDFSSGTITLPVWTPVHPKDS